MGNRWQGLGGSRDDVHPPRLQRIKGRRAQVLWLSHFPTFGSNISFTFQHFPSALSAYILCAMSSTPSTTQKRHVSHWSSDQFTGLPLAPAKKPHEGSADVSDSSNDHNVPSDEDVYIPSADPAASELSSASSAELDNDDGDSDAVGAVAAQTKVVATRNCAGGPAKWDAEAKRAWYVEKYRQMTPDVALGTFFVGHTVVDITDLLSFQPNWPSCGGRPPTSTSSTRLSSWMKMALFTIVSFARSKSERPL